MTHHMQDAIRQYGQSDRTVPVCNNSAGNKQQACTTAEGAPIDYTYTILLTEKPFKQMYTK